MFFLIFGTDPLTYLIPVLGYNSFAVRVKGYKYAYKIAIISPELSHISVKSQQIFSQKFERSVATNSIYHYSQN